jgi:hypothetical protein
LSLWQNPEFAQSDLDPERRLPAGLVAFTPDRLEAGAPRSIPPFPVHRPGGWSGCREGKAPASPSGIWTIMHVLAGRVLRSPGSRIISVSIWKWNQGHRI